MNTGIARIFFVGVDFFSSKSWWPFFSHRP